MDQTAITPSVNDLMPPQLDETEVIDNSWRSEAVKEEKELAAVSAMTGWQKLADEFKSDIDAFKTGAFIKDIDKLSLEEVGKLFIIHQTVATMLQKYLDKVDNAKQAVADYERQRQSSEPKQ